MRLESRSMETPPWTRSVHHDGSARYLRTPPNRDPDYGDEVEVRLRAAPDAPIERVLLRTCPDGEQAFVEMTPETAGPACRWWSARLTLSMPTTHYRFGLFGRDGVFWYNGTGAHRHVPTDADDFRVLADYRSPRWLKGAVFYQIFPDRFADGDPASNVTDGEFIYRGEPARARAWGETPTRGHASSMVEFYGGDLAGIESKLDYLADLGVNALYINPIFRAFSNHRYDVVDYENVDPHLGGNAALAALRRAATARGMRYILDIVPNHCGSEHPWFREALADPRASTADHFTFHRHPDDYLCWLGVRSLPKFNYGSRALRQRMYQGADAVFRRWLRAPYGADGWRIDVANMLGRQGANQLGLEIAEGIRWAVKEENPDALLVGEHFFDGTDQLQGGCWDAMMNYTGFAKPLWYWIGGYHVRQHGRPPRVDSPLPWPTDAIAGTWDAYRAPIPWAIARQQFNLAGSHDTARIRHVAGDDPGLLRLAIGILMTYVGVPCVYYGDEVGLTGEDGDAARGCMPWDEARWDSDLRAFYKRLIHLRRASPALTDGGYQALAIEPDTLAYMRDSDAEVLVVVAHRGSAPRPAGPLPVRDGGIPDGATLTELESGARLTVAGGALPLPAMPRGLAIWRWVP
jgi:alpha-glucosidase